jgi:hypothetical protein
MEEIIISIVIILIILQVKAEIDLEKISQSLIIHISFRMILEDLAMQQLKSTEIMETTIIVIVIIIHLLLAIC